MKLFFDKVLKGLNGKVFIGYVYVLIFLLVFVGDFEDMVIVIKDGSGV